MGANRQLERRKNLPVGGALFVPIIQLRRVRKFVKWSNVREAGKETTRVHPPQLASTTQAGFQRHRSHAIKP